MPLNEHGKELTVMAIIGVLIVLGKLLVSGERVSVRVALGRMIIGAGLSMSAGAALMIFPNLSPTALIGIASAIGILGQSVLEAAVQKYVGRLPERDD